MNFKKKSIFISTLVCFILYITYFFNKNFLKKYFYNFKTKLSQYEKQKTIFGDLIINEKILSDALDNKALLRMKKIDQGGPLVYFKYANPFSRYEHSLGVFALIRIKGGSVEEQLSGLFHDISHTAFSHVADNIFKNNQQEKNTIAEHSYQDDIHLWYIKNTSAYDICNKYNIPLESLNPDLEKYTMLESSLPEMCADRIEYNLHTALKYHLLSEEDIKKILLHLHFDTITYYENKELITRKTWFFDDIISAKKFGLLPLYFIRTIWNAHYNMVFYKFFSHLIKYAFEKKYISKDLFHFGTDQEILEILYKSKDEYIIYMLKCLTKIFDTFEVVNEPNAHYDEILKGKFRGIDPLIKHNDKVQKLSELDFDFKYAYNLVQEECKCGYKIKYKKIYDPVVFYGN